MNETADNRAVQGITLVELMVTITIAVGLMGAGAYSMGMLSTNSLKNESMRMTSAINYTWSRAAMNNAQYRMVFDLDEGSYRTEVTDAPTIQKDRSSESSDEFISEEARKAGEQEEKDEDLFAEDEKDPFNAGRKPTYKQVEDSVLEPYTLPSNVRIAQVVPCDQEKITEKGQAAIHFFPNGFQQPAIIVLANDAGEFFSLKTEPLTGRVRLFGEKLDDTEDCGQPQEVQEEW